MRHIGAVSRNPKWKKEIVDMPEWLKPTAEYGIGMQSVFLLTNSFTIQSRPRFSDDTVQHRIAFNSVRFGGDITRTPCKPKDNPKEGWDDKEENIYPLGTRLEIKPSSRELTEFYKRFHEFPLLSGHNDVYNPNMVLAFKQNCLKYLKNQFFSSIIPLSIKIDGKEVEKIDTVPFAHAEPLLNKPGKDTIRFKDGILHYWHEQHCIMFSFSPVENGDMPGTQFFFRGIRFGGAELDKKSTIAGMNCDINILSGKANEYLEISRDFVKKEKLSQLCSKIEDATKAFFDALISLVKASNEGLHSGLVSIFERSHDFAKQLYTYMLAKHTGKDFEYLKLMADICGGLIDIALLDKKSEVIAFMPEPLIMDSKNIPRKFIDTAEYEEGGKIDLKPSSSSGKVEKILKNDFPMLMGLKFKELEALPITSTDEARKNCVFVYSLNAESEVQGVNLNATDMSYSSYRAVINDIKREYRKRWENNKVDDRYLPIFPAPPQSINNVLDDSDDFEAIKRITFSSQPVDENTYCDDRFTRFILSPLPIGLLCGSDEIKSSDLLEDLLDKIFNCLKKPNEKIDDSMDDIPKMLLEKYLPYYKQAVVYMERQMKKISKEKFEGEFRKEIINIWINKFAVFIRNF